MEYSDNKHKKESLNLDVIPTARQNVSKGKYRVFSKSPNEEKSLDRNDKEKERNGTLVIASLTSFRKIKN